MAVDEIKHRVSDGSSFTFRAALEGVLHGFTFRRNARLDYWTLDLTDAGGNPLLTGARCVVDYTLLAHCGHADQPPVKLLLIDTAQTHTGPGAFDLGARVKLTVVLDDDE